MIAVDRLGQCHEHGRIGWRGDSTACQLISLLPLDLSTDVPIQYMSFPESEVDQPPRLLKGFDKVYLEAGKSRTIEFPLAS